MLLFLKKLPLINTAKYVSINFEIHGLEESVKGLQNSVILLSNRLEGIASSPDEISAEQLKQINLIIVNTESLVTGLGQTIKGIGPSINQAKEPTSELLSQILKTTRAETIDPIVNKIQLWLYLLTIAGIIMVLLAGVALYLSANKFREMAHTLKAISNDYEIVRRQ